MKQRIITSVMALSLLATTPAWGQTNVIKRTPAQQPANRNTKINWDTVTEFHEELAKVRTPYGKFGFVDKSDKLVIPCNWEDAGDFSEGLARVCDKQMYGFLDKTGKLVIPCKWKLV